MKRLVVYFSAEFGVTKKLAEQFAASAAADIFEIKPEKPYTKADLKYVNPLARCNREKLRVVHYITSVSDGVSIG